jgi:hypothetical protein
MRLPAVRLIVPLLLVWAKLTPAGDLSQLPEQFKWKASGALARSKNSSDDTYYSLKDPSVVFHEGRWHLFCTVRGQKRSHQIEYLSFSDWEAIDSARRQMLAMHDGFFCAPQVFYFAPQKKWYLICQASDPSWQPNYQAAYATTDNLADPNSWSKLRPLAAKQAEGKSGLDFWIICDDAKAHLFFTTNDGHMWREDTTLDTFPNGWSGASLALEGDIFEASHTYRLQGQQKYLTVIEAQNGHGWRYQKAYLADRLEGPWAPLAADKDHAFANLDNVVQSSSRWTDSISHGELLRAGFDQRLEVDPGDLRFLFQGVLDRDRTGKAYGQIPWRLGLLTPVP